MPISERSAGRHPWRTPISPCCPWEELGKASWVQAPAPAPLLEAGPLAPEWVLRKQRRELGLVQGNQGRLSLGWARPWISVVTATWLWQDTLHSPGGC